ncbi:MAG: hypothetical protein J0M26_18080 [Planctomycetes bacterium]|nr:hypothetical protein [Planctomycetota bacterium]
MSSVMENTSLNHAGERLRHQMAAVKVSINWFGCRKALSTDQIQQAAIPFDAEGKMLSAGKKILDTSHAAFRGVTKVRGKAIGYWKSLTLPYPEPGIRLLRQASVDSFREEMERFKQELSDAVENLQRHYSELREAARNRLGSLYDPSDYPASIQGLFGIEYEFPSVEPPDYLRRLSPEIYEEECRRVRSRFDEAVTLAEQAFLAELAKLVDHLVERLSGDADGNPKVFRDSAVGNLAEFFQRFRDLNVHSSPELDDLVVRAQRAMRGVTAQALRDRPALQQHVAQQMVSVQASLDQLVTQRPRRNILRRT